MHLIMHVYTHRCTWNCPHGFAVHDLVSPVSYFASPVLFSSSVIQFFHGIGWEGTPQGWSMLCVWLLVALLQHPWVSNYAVIRQHQIEWHQHAHPEKSLSKDFLAIWYICINLPTSSNIFFSWVGRHSTFDHCDFRTILPSKIIPTIPHAESHRHSSKRRWTVHGSIGTVGPMVFLTQKRQVGFQPPGNICRRVEDVLPLRERDGLVKFLGQQNWCHIANHVTWPIWWL